MELEEKICEFFNVPIECLRNKSKIKEHCIARSYTIFFMHTFKNMSHSAVAKEYGMNLRNARKNTDKIKYLITIDTYHKNIYRKLLTVLQFS